MTEVMKGVRIVEVAELAFVPAAAAILGSWGADVVKIEPVERGDAVRGIGAPGDTGVNILFENANRGKRSIGLDLATADGRELLYRLVRDADVFITNKLADVRAKLRIDVADIRAHNPAIIYVRGGSVGEQGPEAGRGSFDLLAFWHRSGASRATAGPTGDPSYLPAPGFGDFTGAMALAGGIMGALYHRAMTGSAPVVDASLLAVGMWSMSAAIASAEARPHWRWPPAVRNPLSWIYETAEGGRVALGCLQAGRYWRPFCDAIGRQDLADDPRFRDHGSILRNETAAIDLLSGIFRQATVADWRRILAHFSGQWTVVQSTADVARDPQVEPNGYLQGCETADGTPFRLVTPPIQFDGVPAPTRRGPTFNEHGDAILSSLGLSWDEIVDLKVRGVVA